MIRVVIIEDESLAREIVLNYLEKYPDVEVIMQCENGFEGLKAIQELRPDLVFLDIQMPKITGFEMLELLPERPEIIFTTAYDQYAIKAFENNAVDYLLKPFTTERFDEAMEKARQRIKSGLKQEEVSEMLDKGSYVETINRIVVRTGAKINVIPVATIEYIQATGDYVEIRSEKGKFLKQVTMKYLEEKLDGREFVRVHRSYIIALSALSKIEHFEKDTHMAIMKGGDKISISRAGYGRLREILQF